MTLIGPHRISVQPNIGGGNYTPYFFDGVYTATSAALPASIQLTDVSRTGDNIKVWWFGLIGAL